MRLRTNSGRLLIGFCLISASCATQDGTQATPGLAGASGETPIVAEGAMSPGAAASAAPATKAVDWQSRRPLVTIPVTLTRNRFQGPLDAAILSALARKPDLGLDVVAVAPILNSPEDQAKVDEISRASAGEVLLALSRLGLAGTRVASYSLADPTAATPEIRLYPR